MVKKSKESEYCTCEGNTFWRLGGEFVSLTKGGMKVTKIKGEKPKCIECNKLKR